MLLLISPAKNLDFDSEPITASHSLPEFEKESKKLISVLKKKKVKEIAELMKLSNPLATLNYERYRSFSYPFTLENAKQAILAFNGEVYTGIDAAAYSEEDFKYAQNHLRILSGLYGILKPLDLIQPYRLEMGTKLEISEKANNLYEYWDKKITEKINDALNESASEYIINLASNEYFRAVKKDLLKGKIINCVFKENKNGAFKVIMVYAKKARGLMSSYIIKNKTDSIDGIKAFDLEGYSLNPTLSTETEFVFTR